MDVLRFFIWCGYVELYKILVEEIFQDSKHPDYKHFHNLKYIEKAAENIGSLTDENKAHHAESTNDVSTTNYNVANLFEYVKQNDSERSEEFVRCVIVEQNVIGTKNTD